MKLILSPSILSADFTKLGEEIQATEANGAEYLHYDVMDGVFVPSISFGMPVLKSIRKATKQVMDVHLMITEPIRYVEEFAKAGADIITVHYEACADLPATIAKIRELGVKVGITINPETDVKVLEPYLDQADMFLIMTVHPGFGGQKLIPECLDKIRWLRDQLDARGLQTDIEIDGGVKLSNLDQVLASGVNVIVAGSAVFGEDTALNTRKFMENL